MLALIKYSYDYHEWEMVIAVSKDKKKLEKEYNRLYPDKEEREIRDKSRQIKKLTDEQIALKRGKAEMVKLRRELDTKS